MATGLEPREQSATGLVAGILSDLQSLVEQQFLLIRREIVRDMKRGMEASSMIAAGALVGFLGGFSLSMAAAEWLYWFNAPDGTDPSSLPRWGCYAIVSVLLLALGAALGLAGRAQFKNIQPLKSPAAEALKENVEWTTNPPT